MKKSVSVIALLVLVMLLLSSCGEYLYFGDGWQNIPEQALAIAADRTLEDMRRLTVENLLDTFYIGDRAYMLFVSKGDTLVQAEFVTNKEGKYHHHGDAEEALLSEPDTLIFTGDPEQFILGDYNQHQTTVWGYKYSSVEIINVNGITPKIKTYKFVCQGREWSIDRWYVEGIGENDEVNIDYYRE